TAVEGPPPSSHPIWPTDNDQFLNAFSHYQVCAANGPCMSSGCQARHTRRTLMPRLITGLVFIVVGVTSSAWATPITISLANSGVQQFLTPFPNIEVTGTSAQPVPSSVGPGTFGYDFVVHVLVPNGGGSLLTGQITFDFGAAGSFVGALSGN